MGHKPRTDARLTQRLLGLFGRAVKEILELRIDSSQSGDDRQAPVNIFAAALIVPTRRRAVCDIFDVADLVAELYKLGFGRQMRSVLDLQTLSLSLWQRFVVGDLHNDVCDSFAESIGDLVTRHADIFDRIVEDGSDQNVDVIDAAGVCKQICDFERMVYVRFLIVPLAVVTNMTHCGKAGRLEKFI